MTANDVGGWIAVAAGTLAAAGLERSRAEARALLAAALSAPASELIGWPERAIAPDARGRADAMLARRAAGEPLARILGAREFWSLTFRLNPDVLEPRPDTETVVAAALALVAERPPRRVLDLGVGSGCILLALLSELPTAYGVGVDLAAGAVAAARTNAFALGFGDRAAFVRGDWGAACAGGTFDLIVANPPYVAKAAGPAPDAATVAHDPPLALWAGADGLDAYRALLPDLPRLLAPDGRAAIEVGAGQADAVAALADAAGLDVVARRADLAGRLRCLALAPRR